MRIRRSSHSGHSRKFAQPRSNAQSPLRPGRVGMSGGASGGGEGVWPPVAAAGNADLAVGGFHALSAFALALLAQLPQLLLRVLQPLPYLQLDLIVYLAEPLQHGVVGNVLLAARVLKDPREGRPDTGEGLRAALLGTGAHDDQVVEAHLAQVGLKPHSDAPGAPDAVQRPWWHRVFGRGR